MQAWRNVSRVKKCPFSVIPPSFPSRHSVCQEFTDFDSFLVDIYIGETKYNSSHTWAGTVSHHIQDRECNMECFQHYIFVVFLFWECHEGFEGLRVLGFVLLFLTLFFPACILRCLIYFLLSFSSASPFPLSLPPVGNFLSISLSLKLRTPFSVNYTFSKENEMRVIWKRRWWLLITPSTLTYTASWCPNPLLLSPGQSRTKVTDRVMESDSF